jgi:uncharacterized protein DUF4388
MIQHTEPRPLAGLAQELARLVSSLSALEVRMAGSLEPEVGEQLARLSSAGQHLAAAQSALAGVAAPRPAPAQDGEHLQGSSRAVPIQDLLCFLATAKKNGVLRVETDDERYLLQLDQGAVVYATGDRPPTGEGLSELLAERGVLSAELLGRLPECTPAGTWIDRNLLGTSWISRDSLESALQQQTRLAFFRLCSAHDTRFRFYEGSEIQNVVPVRQSAMELLLEYSRALDEGIERTLACAPRPEATSVHARGFGDGPAYSPFAG